MKQKTMKNNLYTIFTQGFQSGAFIRVGDNKKLSLYVGKDDKGNFAFDYRGKYVPVKIAQSDVITVQQGKNGDSYTLRFSLCNPELLEYFCTFCQDLLESTELIDNDDDAYKTLCSRYFSWKKLFRPNKGVMNDNEVMGLIGELLFMQDYMIPQWGIEKSLDSWMGPEKTHKDYSTDSVWYEIKTVSAGKETVRISSLEQLDGEDEGYLAVYCLEKMSPTFSGIKLNSLVQNLLNRMGSSQNREVFMSKLSLYNYDFSPEYDNYVFTNVGFSMYCVKDDFPRLSRKTIPNAISKIQYEIFLSEIEGYKL